MWVIMIPIVFIIFPPFNFSMQFTLINFSKYDYRSKLGFTYLFFITLKNFLNPCMYLLQKKFLIDIILALIEKPLAFNEIQIRLTIYSDTLSRRLKELEKFGIIEAIITNEENGKRVRYRLTPKGNKIAPLLIEAKKILTAAEKLIKT